MTRDEFTTDFLRGMRYVLQKHEREIEARRAAGGKPSVALDVANTMTDSAIVLLAEQLFDSLESMREEPSHAA